MMGRWILLFVIFLFGTTEVVAKSSRPALYPRLWAQEMVGADLAQAWLTKNQPPTAKVPHLFVMDESFDPRFVQAPIYDLIRIGTPVKVEPGESIHGNLVANLISGKSKQAISQVGELTLLQAASSRDLNLWLGANAALIQGGWLHFSLGWTAMTDRPAFERLTHLAELSIKSAGNSFPEPISKEESGLSKTIYVGSLSPWGLISEFSSEGPEVEILAPADGDILSWGNGQAAPASFAGTSAAAPVVSGVLMTMRLVLPDLTGSEAFVILRDSGLNYPASAWSPGRNSRKIVNAYRALIWTLAFKSELAGQCLVGDAACRIRILASLDQTKALRDRTHLTAAEEAQVRDLCQTTPSLTSEYRIREAAFRTLDSRWMKCLAEIHGRMNNKATANAYAIFSELIEGKTELLQKTIGDKKTESHLRMRNLVLLDSSKAFAQIKDVALHENSDYEGNFAANMLPLFGADAIPVLTELIQTENRLLRAQFATEAFLKQNAPLDSQVDGLLLAFYAKSPATALDLARQFAKPAVKAKFQSLALAELSTLDLGAQRSLQVSFYCSKDLKSLQKMLGKTQIDDEVVILMQMIKSNDQDSSHLPDVYRLSGNPCLY